MYRAPRLAIGPATALSLAAFGFNMLGDALRDLLDPRLKGGQRSEPAHLGTVRMGERQQRVLPPALRQSRAPQQEVHLAGRRRQRSHLRHHAVRLIGEPDDVAPPRGGGQRVGEAGAVLRAHVGQHRRVEDDQLRVARRLGEQRGKIVDQVTGIVAMKPTTTSSAATARASRS